MTESCQLHCARAQFFDNAREAMYISSREGYFLEVNPAFEALFGYPKKEIEGKKVELILGNAKDRDQFRRMIESDGFVHEYPLSMLRKDGQEIVGLIDATVWRKDGAVAGYHGIIRSRTWVLAACRKVIHQVQEEQKLLQEQRRNLLADTALLSRYLSDDLVKYVGETGKNPLEAGRSRVTVLFFDIRRSTSIAERIPPEEFASFLSEILTDIMDIVCGLKGSVNKLLGDGLLATFGTPVSDISGNDAYNATQAARHIQEYLKTFNDVRPECLTEPVRAGIGLATGTAFAGVIGSVRRQEYTILGDVVNVASRLESLTKTAGYPVLMDEETYHQVKSLERSVPVGRARLRGKNEPILVYRLEDL